MAYSDPLVQAIYTDAAVGKVFVVNFSYAEGETAVIAVEYWNFTDPDLPVEVAPFVLGVDYKITEAGKYPDTEIELLILTEVADDHKLIIYRDTQAIQGASFVNGAFPSESVEEAFDRAVQIGQENKWVLENEAILQPKGLDTPIDILSLNNQVATNVIDIATNAADIASNDIDIAANAANISSNDTDIATNAAGIATNLGNINSNDTDIATNAGNIATNTGDIATNVTNIATNVTNITSNDVDIAALQAAVALLGGPTIVIRTSAGAYLSSNNELIIVRIAGVTVTLPAANIGTQVSVKMDGLYASTIVDGGAANIDGFGTTYTLSSDYESLTFIADGTNWFII